MCMVVTVVSCSCLSGCMSNVISQHELALPLILLSCLGSVLYLMLETYTGVVSTQTLLQREKEGLANIVQPHNMHGLAVAMDFTKS